MSAPRNSLKSLTGLKTCVSTLILVAMNAVTVAQSDQPKEALLSLEKIAKAIQKLQSSVEPKTPEISQRLERIRTQVMALQDAVRSRQVNLGMQPAVYRENLESFSSVLTGIAEHPPPTNLLKDKLESIEQDFAIKERFVSSSRGDPLRQIQAVIYTVDKDSRSKGGYEVWYVPKGLEDYPDEHKRFDNLSTPAIMSLPPGNYVIWAIRENVASDRRPLTLGDDGRSKRDFTLIVK